jgi:hypothetical protein
VCGGSSCELSARIIDFDLKQMEDLPGPFLNPISELLFRSTRQDIRREAWPLMRDLLNRVEMREWKYEGLIFANAYLAWGEKA